MELKPGINCLYASLANMAQVEAWPLSECDLYFIADGVNVAYKPEMRPFYIGSEAEQLLTGLQQYLPIRYKPTDGNSSWIDEMEQLLKQERMLLLYVDSRALTYHSIYQENMGREHFIVAYGADREKDALYVGDSFLLDYSGEALTYSGEASLTDIVQGVYGYAWIEEGVSLPWTKQALMRQALATLDQFVQSSEVYGASPVHKGLAAYRRWFADMVRLEQVDRNSFTETLKNIYYQFRIGSMIHHLDYCAMFVREYAHWLPEDAARNLSRWLTDARADWKKHGLMLYKTAIQHNTRKLAYIAEESGRMLDQHEAQLRAFLVKAQEQLAASGHRA